jgi:hypothetical protein
LMLMKGWMSDVTLATPLWILRSPGTGSH